MTSRYLQQAGSAGSSSGGNGSGSSASSSINLTVGAGKEAAAAAGPAGVKSLLSRVDSCDHDREENEVGGKAEASVGEAKQSMKKKTTRVFFMFEFL